MIYEQHFDNLAGVRFKPDPLAEFTQPQPSVLRIATLPQVGFVQAGFYIDFPSNVIINNISIAITGSSGTFSVNGLDGELFTVVGQSYGVYDPSPPRTVFLDYSWFPGGYIVDSILFGVQRDRFSDVVGYIDYDFIKIDYTITEPPEPPEPEFLKRFYRYKIAKADAGKFPVYFLRDGALVASHYINFREHCTSGKVLKFMDRNGIYRFFPFNEFWEQNNEPDAIGSTELFTDSIYTGQSNKRSLGYKNKRSIAAVAYDVTAYELDILQDLMTSPFVYLYIGTTGDAPKDWLLVEVSGTNTGRRRKGVIGRYEVTIVLPEQFNITML